MKTCLQISYISDGKAGHRSQALGLYHAMQRLSEQQVELYRKKIQFEEVLIDDLSISQLITAIIFRKKHLLSSEPDYLIGVGSHTHLRVMLLSRLYPQAKSIILMKPLLPISCFDYSVIPQHDAVSHHSRVISTVGVLNPIQNEQRHQANRILVALGGDSKRHRWNDQHVIAALQQLVELNPQSDIVLTTSRRTPTQFWQQLQHYEFMQKVHCVAVEDTPQGWIFEQMQLAEAVWVTEDSISMIFEALTAGCRVGLISLPRLKEDRITREIDRLIEQHKLSTQLEIKALNMNYDLQEADRVAKYILMQAID